MPTTRAHLLPKDMWLAKVAALLKSKQQLMAMPRVAYMEAPHSIELKVMRLRIKSRQINSIVKTDLISASAQTRMRMNLFPLIKLLSQLSRKR